MKIRKIIAIAGASLICMTPILLATVDAACYAQGVAVAKATGSEDAGLQAYLACVLAKLY